MGEIAAGVRFAVFQFRVNFRIAHIHPTALNFEAGDEMPGVDHGVDGVRQFVFPPA